MDDNPYASPSTESPALGVISGSRDDLRLVARHQKGVLICILLYFILVFSQFLVPEQLRILLGIALLIVGLAGTVFVFMLATRVYGTGLGILFGLITFVPCLGLIMLLVINGKATSVLKQNGIKVGLLGANLTDI